MANFFCFILLGFICVIFQSTLLGYFGPGGLRIELLIILLTYLAIHHSLTQGCFSVALFGYFYDLNSAAPFGLHALTLMTCFVLLHLVRNHLLIQGPAFCVSLVAFMVVLHDTVQILFLVSRGVPSWPGFFPFLLIFPKALLTGIFWPFFNPLMSWIDQFFPLSYFTRSRSGGLEFIK